MTLVFTPVSVFGYLALSLSGLSHPVSEVRRIFGKQLTVDDDPPAVDALQAATWSATATIGGLLLLYLVGVADTYLKPQNSPFVLKPLVRCDKIGGVAYKLDTIRALEAHLAEGKGRLGTYQAEVCQKLATVDQVGQRGVDAYLDWYFSLGAEWSRIAHMLTGDVDQFLATKFEEIALSGDEIKSLLEGVQGDFERQWNLSIASQSELLQFLEKHRLVLAESQCVVVNELAAHPSLEQFEDLRRRLSAGSAAGVIAGVFSGKVAAKVVTKLSMKSAAKILLKAVAKKTATKAATAVAGAAVGAKVGAMLGSVALPGAGTTVGAAAGAAIGVGATLIFGTGVDIALLAAEEGLKRDDMKKDLLSALSESLQPHRVTFGCQ